LHFLQEIPGGKKKKFEKHKSGWEKEISSLKS
jgi:hypothetical protein